MTDIAPITIHAEVSADDRKTICEHLYNYNVAAIHSRLAEPDISINLVL